MATRFFHFLRREFNGLHEAAFVLGSFALVSQVIAVVRDRMFASHFGAGQELDVYYSAFRIPDIIFASIASFVAITVIMPFFIERLEHDIAGAKRFVDGIFTVFFATIVVVCLIAYILMPYVIDKTMGFDLAMKKEVVMLSRILLLSPILLGISNLFASITQAFRNFVVYSISPVLYNVGIIIGLVFFFPAVGMAGLAYGVILGALLHIGIQIPVVIHHSFLPHVTCAISWKDIRRVVFLALPRTLGLSAQQIALFILTAIASLMAVGSVAVFQLAFNLQSVPLSIIGVSYSVAAFPTLARLYSKQEMGKFTEHVVTALRHIAFWSFPIVGLFIVLRAQIVRTILGAGVFDWEATRLTAAALAIFSISIVAQSIILLLVRGYYAAGKTRIPVVVNVACGVLIIVLAYSFSNMFASMPFVVDFFEALLRIQNVSGSIVLALPLAYSIGMTLNGLVLWHFFKRDFAIGTCEKLRRTFRHSLYSAVMMGTVAYHLLGVFDTIVNIDTFIGIFLQGLFSGLGGIAFGILLLKAIDNEEIEEIQKALRRKFWKTKTIFPDKEDLS